MSRTTRAHLPTDDYAARRNTRRKLRIKEQLHDKTHKAARPNAKATLRKEYR